MTDEEHCSIASNLGYRRLASAVIVQAFRDCERGPGDRRFDDASLFLEATDMWPWLELLDIEAEVIRSALWSGRRIGDRV